MVLTKKNGFRSLYKKPNNLISSQKQLVLKAMKGNKWEDLSNKKPFLSATKRVFVLKKNVF